MTEAVVQPLVAAAAAGDLFCPFCDDLTQKPRLVPVVCLGCAVRTTVHTPATCAAAGEYEVGEPMPMRGGPRLEPMDLRAHMFGAAAMRTS